MSKFIENIRDEKIYDTGLLYKELADLKQIAVSGDELIEKYILNQRFNANKIEFGVLDNCFYIQVIVQTLTQNQYKPIEVNRFKFIYPVEKNKIIITKQQPIEIKIFKFYLTKTIGFLSDLNIRYT